MTNALRLAAVLTAATALYRPGGQFSARSGVQVSARSGGQVSVRSGAQLAVRRDGSCS